MTITYFLRILVSLATVLCWSSASAQDLMFSAKGRVEFNTATSASLLLDDNLPEKFRERLEVRWRQPQQFISTDQWRYVSDGLLINPGEDGDWSNALMKITFPASDQIAQHSEWVELEVYIEAVSHTRFHGITQVRETRELLQRTTVFREEQLLDTGQDQFVLNLIEMSPITVTYNRAASQLRAGRGLSRDHALDAISDLILIFRIAGKRHYLNELATAIEIYLHHDAELPLRELDFVRQLHMHPKFVGLDHDHRAFHLHSLARAFYKAEELDTTLAGTNAINNRDVAQTLLSHVRVPLDLKEGTELSDGVVDALQLRMEIVCGNKSFKCFSEMETIKALDVKHQIDAEKMRNILGEYIRMLVDTSKDFAQRQHPDKEFVDAVAQHRQLRKAWLIFSCALEQNDERLMWVTLERQFLNEGEWAEQIRDKAPSGRATCT